MQLLQLDDRHAFEEIYSRYRIPIYSYLSVQVNKSVAEELMQETFIKILNKRSLFNFESKFKTWIWTIAKNTLRDFWRSNDYKTHSIKDPIYNEESGEELFFNEQDLVEDLYFQKITKKQLLNCIDELPLEQKELFVMHLHSELSNQDIADLSNLSLGAVKSILFRSKEKLIKCFKKGGHL